MDVDYHIEPEIERMLEIFRDAVGLAGEGMPEKAFRDNSLVPADRSKPGLWKMMDPATCVGETFGTTLHLPKSVQFLPELREALATATAIRYCGERRYLERTGFIVYQPGSGMGWHTNANRPGLRVYYTYNADTGIFRYVENGEEKEIYEPAGWHMKSFYVPEGSGMWHAIEAPSFRLSIGFRALDRKP